MTKWLLFLFSLIAIFLFCFPASPEIQVGGSLRKVSPITIRPEWDRFRILVWQHRTSVDKDFDLYRQVGLGGFHIDRGAGQEKLAEFSMKEKFPYYVDHAADKGLLHLTRENANAVKGKHGLIIRPHSLADPNTMAVMKQHLARNITSTKNGLVLAYAFDDEISLGSFVNPCDVDNHPHSIVWFRNWLRHQYELIETLNKKWDVSFKSFDEVVPKGFEEVRQKAQKPPLSQWNLAPWMDFRHFMDFQFASVLSELTRYANGLDSKIPAGFVGGQSPGPYGGYDYAMLARSVQWMEAYDTYGTNEILRSFWNSERRPRMLTFHSTKNVKLDSWFLWYYLLHGSQAVIAWPEGWFRSGTYEIAPHVHEMKDTFKEIQGRISEYIVSPKTTFDPDPIGIYYSHPSIQAGWVMDVITHGKSWINRKSSIDDYNQTAGIIRNVWCKVLEDLGFQYDFISYLDVEEGTMDLNEKFKVIILPRTICLSDGEAKALRGFVMNGGTLIADYLCGVLDKHGKGRMRGVLDDLFGIIRDESVAYMNGKGLTEIDGEKYNQPFLKRLTFYEDAYRYKGIMVFERGTKHRTGTKAVEIKDGLNLLHRASILIENKKGYGKTFYLNLSPIEYWDPYKRFSEYGEIFRRMILEIMSLIGVQPRVRIYEDENRWNMIEPLYWKNDNKHYLGLVKNPTEQMELSGVGKSAQVQGITGQEVEIRLEFKKSVRGLVNLRTNKHLGPGEVFNDKFKPWEGNLYEVIY